MSYERPKSKFWKGEAEAPAASTQATDADAKTGPRFEDTSLGQLAQGIINYRKALVDSGMTGELADALVLQVHSELAEKFGA